MTITIGFGWWLLPFAVTVIVFSWAFIKTPRDSFINAGSFSFPDITGIFTYGAASIVSLLAWLIWAVLT